MGGLGKSGRLVFHLSVIAATAAAQKWSCMATATALDALSSAIDGCVASPYLYLSLCLSQVQGFQVGFGGVVGVVEAWVSPKGVASATYPHPPYRRNVAQVLIACLPLCLARASQGSVLGFRAFVRMKSKTPLSFSLFFLIFA